MNVHDIIETHRVIPVVVINEIEQTIPMLSALLGGGLPIAEITFRTACAKEAIALAVRQFPNMLIGAGTVINDEQCRDAVAAGAKFIVSPGFSKEVLAVCREEDVPYFPGCVTPTEIMEALFLGLTILKFFPAKVYGGLSAINALGAAFPAVRFIPTGGADQTNLAEYLKNPKIYAIGGSFMMQGDIEAKSREIMDIVRENL